MGHSFSLLLSKNQNSVCLLVKHQRRLRSGTSRRNYDFSQLRHANHLHFWWLRLHQNLFRTLLLHQKRTLYKGLVKICHPVEGIAANRLLGRNIVLHSNHVRVLEKGWLLKLSEGRVVLRLAEQVERLSILRLSLLLSLLSQRSCFKSRFEIFFLSDQPSLLVKPSNFVNC